MPYNGTFQFIASSSNLTRLRRNHKERAQPLERERWGLLEKKKDYKLRAKDHKEKRKRLKTLRVKAKDRNPDEFHFGMLSTKTVKGIKIGDRGNTALSLDVVKLLKTQDAGYLRTILQQTRKERERLEASLLLDGGSEKGRVKLLGQDGEAGRHTLFVDSVSEQKAIAKASRRVNEESRTESNDEEDDVDAEVDITRAQDSLDGKTSMEDAHRVRSAALERLRLLEAIKKRERELATAEQELDLQRAKMSNSVGGFNKKGVKFKIRERKR